jgi:hypothetical protein
MSDPLELEVSRALRQVPLRRAPPSLEARVLAEIDRKAALPWWRRSFARWPGPARVGFAMTCVALIAALLALTRPWAPGAALAGAGARAAGSWLPWARPALTLIDVARQLEAALVRVVPLDWLYGAMAAGALLYTALFGLGAVAYRTLYLNTSSAGDFPS